MARPATSLNLDSQIYAFAEVAKLERRVAEIDGLVGMIKRKCLDNTHGALPDLVNGTNELRWHLKHVATQLFYLEQHLGITGRRPPELPSEAPAAPADQKGAAGLRGSTDTLGIPDLMNLLSSLKKTGTLTLHAGSTMFVLEFLEGAIVHAVTNQRSPEWRLGTILEAQCKLTGEQLRESLAAVERTKQLLGDELLRTALVSESDLRTALELQVRNLFSNIFALSYARFAFDEGSISSVGQRVCLNTTQLLLETARLRDEEQRMPALQVPESEPTPAQS